MYLDLTTLYFIVSLKFVLSLDPYITGGDITTYKKYPHAVLLLLGDEGTVCGGSVINQETILTAAHCLEEPEDVKIKITVKYGHEVVTKMKSTNMKKFMRHYDYDEEILLNDIGLLTTVNKIPLNVVKRVILMKYPPKAEHGYVSGWGNDENNYLQNTLKHTEAEMQNYAVCLDLGWLPAGVFCAGPVKGIDAAAEGDSGGALVINEYIQIGIVSYKTPKHSLVGYTNVSYFLEWIIRSAKQLYCNN